MNKVLLYSTGNYNQYPIINHNVKEYEIYIYIQLNHSYIYKTKSHCCTAETNTTLKNQLYFNKK